VHTRGPGGASHEKQIGHEGRMKSRFAEHSYSLAELITAPITPGFGDQTGFKSPNPVPSCQGLWFQGALPFLSIFLTPSDKTRVYSSRLTCSTQLSPHKQGAKLTL